jgi:carboxy-cis,cis-muconate cyclase
MSVIGFLASVTTAVRHNMFISSFRSRHLFAVSYDDETGITQEERAMFGNAGHTWLTFNKDRSTMYASERNGFSSYKVVTPSVLAPSGTLPGGRCQANNKEAGETALIASHAPPFSLYGSGGKSPCSWVISVRPDGSLNGIAQSLVYNRPGPPSESSNGSRVEGFAMAKDGRWLFSADSRGEGIWTHAVNSQGLLGISRFTPIHIEDVRPRRLAVHPSGNFLYVTGRRPNEILTFEVFPSASPEQPPTLVMLDVRIHLVPTGKHII